MWAGIDFVIVIVVVSVLVCYRIITCYSRGLFDKFGCDLIQLDP